jgi:hypothetical protein
LEFAILNEESTRKIAKVDGNKATRKLMTPDNEGIYDLLSILRQLTLFQENLF